MIHDYTKLVQERFDSPVIMKLKRTSANVLSTSLDTDAMAWQEKLEEIAQEFRLSCRFCLMRIFQQRAINQKQGTEDSFWLEAEKKRFFFSDITIEHVECMSQEESDAYCAYMEALARKRPCPEDWEKLEFPELEKCTPEEYERRLIKKAWSHRLVGKKEYVLSRKEAFRLGHMLAFNRSEMEEFLLRVFDYEEGFRFNTSNDLIEAYGLQKGKNWLDVEKLKQDYNKKTEGIRKKEREERNQNWTRKNEEISVNGFDSDEKFLEWMESNAWALDTCSRTACRIYRNLAAKCLCLKDAAEGSELGDCVDDILEEKTESQLAQKLLFDNGKLSESKCEALARQLIEINWTQAQGYRQSAQKSWNVPTLTDKQSKFSTSNGPINRPKRIESLLLGIEQVEKSDVIFMLWVMANQIWPQSERDPEEVSSRIMDLIETCDKCLKKAGLQPFYVPHLLERTMLMVIVRAEMEEDDISPATEYEWILNLEKDIKQSEAEEAGKDSIREKESGYHRHSPEEWLLLVKLYRKRLEFTGKQFAEWAGISEPSLYSKQSEFVKANVLEPLNRKKAWKQREAELKKENLLDAVLKIRDKLLEASPEDRKKALEDALEEIKEESRKKKK